MRLRIVALCLCVLSGSGCAANKYCLEKQDYESAESVPPLAGAEGLKLPESATALRIPPPPAQPAPFGEVVKDAEGDERTTCLDMPPRMAAPPEPAPEQTPPAEPKAPT